MTERIYTARDNTVTIQAQNGGVAADISAATKISVFLDGAEFNSVDDAAMFDVTDLANGNVTISLGAAGLEVGTYTLRFVTFDAVNTNGITWAHETDSTPTLLRVV